MRRYPILIAAFAVLLFNRDEGCAAPTLPEQLPPPPTCAQEALIPEWRALSTTRFEPMQGSLPAQTNAAGGHRLMLNFNATKHARASWDIPVQLDLRRTKGIQFDVYCSDLKPVQYFTCYLRSGSGWYSCTFNPDATHQWVRIVIPKSEVETEGNPAGWQTIDCIRISAWRGTSEDAVCGFANLAFAGGKPIALVVRAESCIKKKDAEARGYSDYANSISETFDAINFPSIQVADDELTETQLDAIQLLVLPYNTTVPPSLAQILTSFCARGGKILACYTTAPDVLNLLKLKVSRTVVPEQGPFQGFAKTPQGLDLQPDFVPQPSHRTVVVEPSATNVASRVIAFWQENDKTNASLPAITLTASGAYIGHVWYAAKTADKNDLMRTLVGELVPAFWEQTARQAYAEIGVLSTHTNLTSLARALQAAPKPARVELERAQEAARQASDALATHAWKQSLPASLRARDAALRAWCSAQPSRTPEFRAFWCHSAYGLQDRNWDRAMRLLKESGFNAVLPNMLWGGVAFYPSEVLPTYAEFDQRGDQLEKCLAAAKKYNIRVHVWKVNWNTGWKVPPSFLAQIAQEQRGQKRLTGELKSAWLCPSHPKNQDLEVAAMIEVVRKYPVDGIHFDYIRYPDNDSCFCEGCKVRFEQRIGKKLATWKEVQIGEPLFNAWQEFRRSNISTVVERVHREAKKIRPDIQISAAVFRNWPSDRDTVAQDWKVWCDNGWLDFVCPMDYFDSNMSFQNAVAAQKTYAGKVPLYPGIGLSCWRNPQDAVKLIEQIAYVRALDVPGFTVFNLDAHAEAVLPYLRLGATHP